MSSKIQRYKCWPELGLAGPMRIAEDGYWVRYSAMKAIEKQRDELLTMLQRVESWSGNELALGPVMLGEVRELIAKVRRTK